MAGKKKGKKGKSQESEGQSSGSQQQGSSGDQPPQRAPQPQAGPPAQQPQRGPQGPQQPPHGPQGQQRGPQGSQQPQRGPQGQQRGPQGPQHPHQGSPGPQQPPHGPQGQQRGPQGPQQHQQGPPGPQQPQQGPPGQQQWGPLGLPQQGPPGQQQRGPPGLQPLQYGPPGQQPPWGHQQLQQGPPIQQLQTPEGQGAPWMAQGPPPQGQQGQRGRGRGRGGGHGQTHQDTQRGPPGPEPQHPQYQQAPQEQRGFGRGQGAPPPQQHEFPQPQPPHYQQQQQGPPRGQPHQRGRGQGRPQGPPQGYQAPQQPMSPMAGPSRPGVIEGTIPQAARQVSGMQISRIEAGQGDTTFEPMESKVRIKPGTKGRRIIVETNHLPLDLGSLKSAIHYDVNLVPDLPKNMLRTVMETFRRKHYPKRYPAFDGRKNLYSSSSLPFGDFIGDEIVIRDAEGREKKFKVEVKFANNVDLRPLRDLLSSRETPREAMQVVDIVLRSAPALTCIPVGRSFFIKPATIIDLGEGMEMYNGFYQAAIRGWKPFLNVDVAHKAFPKHMNLIDALPELFDSYHQPFRREHLVKPLSRYQEDTLEKFIKTLKVSYEIPNQSATRRIYRVNGIDVAPKDKMFTLDNGQKISVEKYFEKNKNYRLRYPHLPTLWVGARQRENKILLPLELCTLEEGQVLNRKMTENQTSKMIRHAATSTGVRKGKIMTALGQANHNNDPTVREFGFSIGNTMEKLEARVLDPPALGYANNKMIRPGRGVWRSERFFSGVTINRWTIACVDRRPPRPDDLSNLAEQIFRNAAMCGMNITSQAERPFDQISGSQSIHDIRKFFQTKKEKKYDVIFIVVPNSGPQYSYVKTAAEINVGCLTQCIKVRTLGKMNQQTAVNILLKVNSKLNGTNHCLLNRPPIMSRPCMIMGADVTHPGPDATEIPSVAAVTASHDPKAFQYNICWRLQAPKVEIIEDLEAIVIEQLKYFHLKTKVKPERIVFFRDGVSEGQFDQVRNAEIRAIRSACKKLQADGYEPSITFLVVQKRHHTRLFPTNPKDSEDKNMNVPAGTCVDTTITHPFMQDFYLVSHASIQGVAKPTKYCTLWDDNNMSHDDIEELTYFLCHMFTRCNRSVSYPAPTYYAHLAAARAKVYIENERLNMDQLQREFDRFQIQDVIRKGLPMFFV